LPESPFLYAYVPGKHLTVYREPLLERMRVLDEKFQLVSEWAGEVVTDEDGDETHRKLGRFACSPDGTRIAQIEGRRLVLRDLSSGSKLAEGSAPGNTVRWLADEPGPTVGRTHLNAELEPVRTDPPAPRGATFSLAPGLGLVPDGEELRLVRVNEEREEELARLGPFTNCPTFAALSPNGNFIVLLDEYWNAFVHEAETGKRTGQTRLPEMGFALTIAPDSKSFLVGGLRGAVMRYDMTGKLLWNTPLAPHNESLKTAELPNVDTTIPDHTEALFKPLIDEPAELDQLVALDDNRLENGSFEADDGWLVDTNAGVATVQYATGGHESKRCLKVGDRSVEQRISGLIGDHFTWVLEFFCKSATPGSDVQLLAGLNVENKDPDSVVRVLSCGGNWQFVRMVIKSGADARSIGVGFQGQGGEALVDDVTLRRIRFPSVNHMLHRPVYDVEPVVLRNPLFYKTYDPIGVLREEIPNIILAQRPNQIADALLCDSFLQNGRLNEISSDWYHSYLEDHTTRISMGLKEPRWVSMVAIYFNAYDQANTTKHFDIYVSDVERRKITRVASVRNNTSLFRLIKFPARRADEVRVELINALPRQRTVTELEVYGPLSGSEKQGFVDAEGQNTYMGSFSRVEKHRV